MARRPVGEAKTRAAKAAATAEAEAGQAEPTERDRRMRAFAKAAKDMVGWKRPAEALTRVRAVPTRFPYFDYVTRVGGLPIERTTIVHGASGHGKTALTIGLGGSFLDAGHAYGHIDAEYTTPNDWITKMLGAWVLDAPTFHAARPGTFEEIVDLVDGFTGMIIDGKASGALKDDVAGVVVVDSVRKMIPKNILEKIQAFAAEGDKGSVDGMGGRAAQIKAALNAAWMDRITPRLAQASTALVLIGREIDDPNASADDRKFGRGWKLSGGNSLIFEASLQVRVVRESYVTEGPREKPRVIGERHRLEVHKTKVSAKDDKVLKAWFHTSNGTIVPEGFDRARDVLELGKRLGVVGASGAWVTWRKKRWNGINRAVASLTLKEPDALAEMESEVRARFDVEPEEEADDGLRVVNA